jgi:hypothetical protein
LGIPVILILFYGLGSQLASVAVVHGALKSRIFQGKIVLLVDVDSMLGGSLKIVESLFLWADRDPSGKCHLQKHTKPWGTARLSREFAYGDLLIMDK